MAGCLRLSAEKNAETETNQPPKLTTQSASRSTPGAQPTETNTPNDPDSAETPADVTAVPYPTGLSDDGITEFLYQTHLRALRADTFRANWTKLDRTSSTFREQKEYTVGVGAARGSWTRIRGGRLEIYRRQNNAFWRETIGSDYTYGNDQDGYDIGDLVWSGEIEPFLTVGDWGQPQRVNDSRPVIWEVTANTLANNTPVPGYHDDGQVQSLSSGTLRIDEDGIIRSFDAQYQVDNGKTDGEVVTYDSSFEITGLDTTVSAPEPSWLDTARAQTPSVSAAYAGDKEFVRMTIDSGNPMASGTVLVVFDEGDTSNRFEVELSTPLEPGETAYLYTTEESGSVRDGEVARGEMPNKASPERLAATYGLSARRRTTTYFDPVTVQ